jgi:hypothetical protein
LGGLWVQWTAQSKEIRQESRLEPPVLGSTLGARLGDALRTKLRLALGASVVCLEPNRETRLEMRCGFDTVLCLE